jgi:hypothetical protein
MFVVAFTAHSQLHPKSLQSASQLMPISGLAALQNQKRKHGQAAPVDISALQNVNFRNARAEGEEGLRCSE